MREDDRAERFEVASDVSRDRDERGEAADEERPRRPACHARRARARAARSSSPSAAPVKRDRGADPDEIHLLGFGDEDERQIEEDGDRHAREQARRARRREIQRHATSATIGSSVANQLATGCHGRSAGTSLKTPVSPCVQVDPGGVVRRPAVAAELSERGRAPARGAPRRAAPAAPTKAHGAGRRSGSATRRVIACTVRIAGSSIRPSSLTMNAATPKTSSGSHQTSGRARTACHHRNARQHDERLRQVHLVGDPRDERVRHGRMRDDQQRRRRPPRSCAPVSRCASHPVEAGGDGEEGQRDGVMRRWR